MSLSLSAPVAGIVARCSLQSLSLNEIFIGGGIVGLRRPLEESKHRPAKGRGDGEIDGEVRGRVEGDAEVGDLSDRSSSVGLIDVTNVENQREKSIGKVTTDETTDDDDQAQRQSVDRRSSSRRRLHSTE